MNGVLNFFVLFFKNWFGELVSEQNFKWANEWVSQAALVSQLNILSTHECNSMALLLLLNIYAHWMRWLTKNQNRRNIEQHYLLWFPSQTVNYDRFEAINSLTTSHGLFSYFRFKCFSLLQNLRKKNYYNILCNKRHVLTRNFIYAHWKTLFGKEREREKMKQKQNAHRRALIILWMRMFVTNRVLYWIVGEILRTNRYRHNSSCLEEEAMMVTFTARS